MEAHDKPEPAVATESKLREVEQCCISTDSLLAEISYSPARDKLYFATSSGEKCTHYDTPQYRIIPPLGLKEFCWNGILKLPVEAAPSGGQETLASDIKQFISRYVDIPFEWCEPVSRYILMTWVYDRFAAVPYLRFLGEAGTGKTRLLEICSSLCFRPLMVSGNITGPALFRSTDLIRGTLLIDESDLRNSAEWNDIVKVINNGYSNSAPVIRCDKDNGFHPTSYHVFGPKILSSRGRYEDDATESRCLTFETIKRRVRKEVPLQLGPEFVEETVALRNRLLGFRFENLRAIKPNDAPLRHLEPRVAQIGASLLAVTSGESTATMVRFLESYSADRREQGLEGAVRQALAEPGGQDRRLQDIACRVNELLQDVGEHSSVQRIGGMVRSLGYEVVRRKQGMVVLV